MVETHQLPSWQPKDDTKHGGQQYIRVGGVNIGGGVLVTSWGNSVPSTLVLGDIAVLWKMPTTQGSQESASQDTHNVAPESPEIKP